MRSPHVTFIEPLPHGKKMCMSDRIEFVICGENCQFVGEFNDPRNYANDAESVLHKFGFEFIIVPVFESIANQIKQNISSVEARDHLLPRLDERGDGGVLKWKNSLYRYLLKIPYQKK